MGANINTILITNLLSGMDYNVKIFASQASGFSDALTGVVKTRKTDVLLPQPHTRFCTVTQPLLHLDGLVFLFLSVALSGWCFMERKVFSLLRAVAQSPGWQANVRAWPSTILDGCGQEFPLQSLCWRF